MERWVSSDSPRQWGHWEQQSWEVSLGKCALLEVTISPTIQTKMDGSGRLIQMNILSTTMCKKEKEMATHSGILA